VFSCRFFCLVAVCVVNCASARGEGVLFPAKDWHYWTTVKTQPFEKDTENPIFVAKGNFSALLSGANAYEEFDANSIRVALLEADGSLWEMPSVLDKAERFQAKGNAAGFVIWRYEGKLPAKQPLTFRVYFDVLKNGPKAAPQYKQSLPPANLFRNGGFEEEDPEHPGSPAQMAWSMGHGNYAGNGGNCRLDKDVAHSGAYSLKMIAAEPKKYAQLYTGMPAHRIAVTPATTYRLSFWARNEKNAEWSIVANVMGYRQDGADWGKIHTISSKDSQYDWRQFEGTFTTPSDCASLSVSFLLYGAAVTWLDDVRLEYAAPYLLRGIEFSPPVTR
jgi:hypothetical protein